MFCPSLGQQRVDIRQTQYACRTDVEMIGMDCRKPSGSSTCSITSKAVIQSYISDEGNSSMRARRTLKPSSLACWTATPDSSIPHASAPPPQLSTQRRHWHSLRLATCRLASPIAALFAVGRQPCAPSFHALRERPVHAFRKLGVIVVCKFLLRGQRPLQF